MQPVDASDVIRIQRRWIVGGLVAMHAVALVVGVWIVGGQPSDFRIDGYAGLCFAQSTLLAVWFALGRSPWWLRVVCTVTSLAAVALGLILGADVLRNGQQGWVAFLVVAPAAIVAAALLAMRRLGLILSTAGPHADEPGALRRQFGTRDMFYATLLAALLLAGWQTARENLLRVRTAINLARALLLASVGIALSVTWLVLGRSRLRWRLAAIPLIAACMFYVGYADRTWELTIIFAAQAVIQLATLMVFRYCGVRLAADRGAAPVELL